MPELQNLHISLNLLVLSSIHLYWTNAILLIVSPDPSVSRRQEKTLILCAIIFIYVYNAIAGFNVSLAITGYEIHSLWYLQ